ncbi:rhomboid family intramembrane serine protease [Marinomonas algarum]|uniref:Rhomboid family intramembrane serine protease n=1 Tax=Marinomonas algarum TaxID=2883105 RepID=A0A9X1LER3_9GAMM|nr:rhomboid family intramembrane serine protease [Marinomonas algarum]MCB5161878.1 rhomboid family intramembrane serine protease [Marinomonas algarum]
MYLIYEFANTEDPAAITAALWRNKVAHQVVSKDGKQQLWITDPKQLSTVEALFTVWKQDPERLATFHPHTSFSQPVDSLSSQHSSGSFAAKFKQAPMTAFVLLATLLVAVITQLGGDLATVGYFSISPFEVRNGQIYFFTLSQVTEKQEYWRFFTPALLHFSVMHLVFNTLWVWDIGSKLEQRLGSLIWSLGVLAIAVTSNLLQYQISGYPLFGGLSGVVYGLIGFAWLVPLLNRRWPTLVSKPLMVFFALWLLVGYTPFPEMLGLGSIANTAHTIGLISGLVLALLYWAMTLRSAHK